MLENWLEVTDNETEKRTLTDKRERVRVKKREREKFSVTQGNENIDQQAENVLEYPTPPPLDK